MTRAQRSLTLSWCRERRRGREKYPQLPSRFLVEMQLDAQPNAVDGEPLGQLQVELTQVVLAVVLAFPHQADDA